MTSDATYLDRILAAKRAELAAARRERNSTLTERQLEQAMAGLGPTRDFTAALRSGPAPRVIAEFKRASPSAGVIREQASVEEIVSSYERAGAAAISVLTDRHFQGSLADLERARATTSLPILRKDFIVERSQILEARQAGADAVLLIVAALPPPTLKQFIDFAHSLQLAVLCEAHDAHELDRAMTAGAQIVGINNRDLRTFAIDLELSVTLRTYVPMSFTYVAESGISTVEHLRRLQDASVDAALIGSTLMAAEDPESALQSLLEGIYG